MDTTLLVDINGYWERLDLFEDIPITLVIQQSDLTDLTSRRTPYSRTIDIPGTANNDNVFEHYYEVNGTDFNPLNKVNCVVQYRGTDLFNGILRMNAVKNQPGNARVYEVYILGEVADFAQEIREVTLQQLNWIDLQHELNYDNVVQSWNAKHNDVDGLFGGSVLYPLINYGLDYQGTSTTPSMDYSFDQPRSFDQPGYSLPIELLKPALKVKTIVDKIFGLSSYEIKSDFFETDYFKSIYMDTFLNGKNGISPASGSAPSNIFKVYTRPQTIITYNVPGERPFIWDTFRNDGYDPLRHFTLASPASSNNFDPPTEAYTDNNFFQIPYAGDYFWNWRFNVDSPIQATKDIRFRLRARRGFDLNTLDTETPFYETGIYKMDSYEPIPFNIFFSASCLTGEYIRLYIDFVSGTPDQFLRIGPYNQSGVFTLAPCWDLYNSPKLLGTDLVDFSLNIPNINCFDYLKSLISIFNLVILQDVITKQIRIEPYTWYYNNDERIERDWTQKLDLNSEYRIEPLSFDLTKENIWTWKYTDYEFLNKRFTDTNDYVFGRYRYVSPNTILAGKSEYEVPYGGCPTNGVEGAPNFIIPEYYYVNNGLKTPYATIPHLFFWVGNRYAYKDALKRVQGTWYLTSGSTPVEQTTYPAVSHLSFLDSGVSSIISDLNFGSNFDFFGNTNNQIAQFTPYNVYNVFWQSFIDNAYSPETRRLSGKFFFKPIEFNEIKLNDKIFIKDAYYSIERIDGADLVNRKMTDVSLIKQNIPYYKITPPAPYYLIEPNQPYPGFTPAFQTPCFVSPTQSEVCNGTTPNITIVTTFGNGTIGNFSELWIEVDMVMTPLPIGNYVRQQNIVDAPTYLVIDNQGRIIQVNC